MKKRLISVVVVLGAAVGALFSAPTAALAMPTGPDGRLAMPTGPDGRLAMPTSVAPAGIPTTVTPSTYTVRSGDTLSAIGTSVGRSWMALAGWNQLADPNLIMPGQVLRIPPSTYVARADHLESGLASSPAPVRSAPEAVQTTHASASTSWSPSGVWACIAQHESGGNPAENTGNGYYGMYQFDRDSWLAAGGGRYAPRADEASASEQTIIAEAWQRMAGWGAWPVTSRECGV